LSCHCYGNLLSLASVINSDTQHCMNHVLLHAEVLCCLSYIISHSSGSSLFDQLDLCPAGSTCCCMREYFGYCFTWACCPLPEATCCEDHIHCCPNNLPVCDIDAGRCLNKAGEGSDDSAEWFTKTPAETVSVPISFCSTI